MKHSTSVGVAVVGYPGAGKSFVAQKFEEQCDALYLETGDVVRREAVKEIDGVDSVDDLTSDELGEYSTMRRERDGGDYVAQDIIADLEESDEFPESPVIVSGMRDSEVPELFEEFFDEFTIVWVHAPFHMRLDRLQTRGRQDEDGMTADDLVRRDEREEDWGTGDLTELADEVLINRGTVEELDAKVADLADRLVDD